MKEPWFRSPMLGRLEPVHWKGWACLGALALMLVTGAVLDDVLRSYGNSLLYYAVMGPLGVAILVLADIMSGATKRK